MIRTDLDRATVEEVVTYFGTTFADSWVARQVGGHMTCEEAEAAALVIGLTDPDAAQKFLYGHANGEQYVDGKHAPNDTEGDRHYWMTDEYDADAADADHKAVHGTGEDPTLCGQCDQPIEHTDLTGPNDDGLRHRRVDEVARLRWRTERGSR